MRHIKYVFYIFTLITFVTNSCAFAQSEKIIKYYDSLWEITTKDSAFYYRELIKQDTLYRSTTYWARSNKINTKAFYLDTTFSKRIGLYHSFYENGQTEDSIFYISSAKPVYSYSFYKNSQLQDSVFYAPNGNITAYRYYEDGELCVHYMYDKKTDKKTTEAYSEDGKKLDNYIYEREAEFSDNENAWKKFLMNTLDPGVPIRNGAPAGIYQVMVKFIVSRDGTVTNVVAQTHYGYGMEAEAIRVIKNSPKWEIAGVQFNKPVNSYRRQPITFVVQY